MVAKLIIETDRSKGMVRSHTITLHAGAVQKVSRAAH